MYLSFRKAINTWQFPFMPSSKDTSYSINAFFSAFHFSTFWTQDSCPKLLSLENPFKFIWNLKSRFKSEIFLSGLKIYFKRGPCGVVPYACIQVYNVICLNTCTLQFLSGLKIYFKRGPCGVVPYACIQVYNVICLNTCTLHPLSGSMFEINFQTG